MLNFAEQTGSGAVMLVWSFPLLREFLDYIYNPIYKNKINNLISDRLLFISVLLPPTTINKLVTTVGL